MANIFYIYTTAILYNESDRRMINSWKNLLESTLNCIPERYNQIIINHYDVKIKPPQNRSELIQQVEDIDKFVCKERLKETKFREDFFPTDLDVPKENILIDMGHVMSYSMHGKSEVDIIYNKKYIRNFNYIYLGFDNFISRNKTKENERLNNLKLFIVENDGNVITFHNILDDLNIVKLYENGKHTLFTNHEGTGELDKVIAKEYENDLKNQGYNLGKCMWRNYENHGLKWKTDHVKELTLKQKIDFLWDKWKLTPKVKKDNDRKRVDASAAISQLNAHKHIADTNNNYKNQLLNIYPLPKII